MKIHKVCLYPGTSLIFTINLGDKLFYQFLKIGNVELVIFSSETGDGRDGLKSGFSESKASVLSLMLY